MKSNAKKYSQLITVLSEKLKLWKDLDSTVNNIIICINYLVGQLNSMQAEVTQPKQTGKEEETKKESENLLASK